MRRWLLGLGFILLTILANQYPLKTLAATGTLTPTPNCTPAPKPANTRTPNATRPRGCPTLTKTATRTRTPTKTRTATRTRTRTRAPVATLVPTTSRSGGGVNIYDTNGDGRVTCADFQTQAQAQEAFNAGYTRLDGNDNDGKACESLP